MRPTLHVFAGPSAYVNRSQTLTYAQNTKHQTPKHQNTKHEGKKKVGAKSHYPHRNRLAGHFQQTVRLPFEEVPSTWRAPAVLDANAYIMGFISTTPSCDGRDGQGFNAVFRTNL